MFTLLPRPALVLPVVATIISVACKPTQPPRVGPIDVVGTLAIAGPDNQATPAGVIELPDIPVTLRDVTTSHDVDSATTALDGKFLLIAPHAGTYSVCWKAAGIASTCGAKFVVNVSDVFLKIVPARALANVVYGKVLTRDSRACWIMDSFFKLDVSTKISLQALSGPPVPSSVRANVEGEYAMGGIPGGRYNVIAECENARVQALASVSATMSSVNLTLPNSAPSIVAIGAFSGGRAMSRAPTGAGVQVAATARDKDQDPVEYLWRVLDGSGSITGSNSPQQTWTLPSSAGTHSAYVIARDGKGGYAYERFDLPVGAVNVGFSGRVIDETTKAPVSGASVSSGSTSTTTNAQGWFSLAVAPMPAPERYVLNISHANYALLSAVHDKAASGSTYELIRTQTTTHDPASGIDVVDNGSSGPCGLPGGKATDQRMSLQARANRLTAANGGHSYFAKPDPCRHRGAQVILPANALVDAHGNPAQGPVTLSLASLNPERRALPGDYRALNSNNAPVEMLSFGALYAQFRDNGGQEVNLKPGVTAEIRVPVSTRQQPSAKPTIPVWGYDETSGMWRQEGQASLQNTPAGWMYVGKTKHFSTLNMDVAGNDPAQSTCVRFELGQSLAGWTNLVVRAYVSYGGSSVQVKETSLDGDQYHAIYRIPYAPPAPPPNTLRLELRGTYNGTEVVLLNNIINTDAPRPKMTGNNLWPPYNYSECGDVVTLEADPVNLPYYGDLDAAGRPAFLGGPFGTFVSANGDQDATNYYNTIDPGNANPTLASWWTNHGFNADGTGGTSAQYLNNNDLGFGRDMNCKVTGGDLACYVTNYGLPDQNPANADAAASRDASKRGATVAMEYKASEPADRRVRFFVYGGGDPATAGKLKFADLDGLGPKSIPQLCTVCHGGRFEASTTNARNSRFREFDLPSFKYSQGRSWDFAPAPSTLSPAELSAFSTLNKMVSDIAPAGSPIQDLIAKWYPGNTAGNANTAPVKPAVPSGWSSQVNGYHNVYAQSCRTCHLARDNGATNNYITFYSSSTAANDYGGTASLVCYSPKVMPNAFVTYKNFWSDLQRVIDYRALTNETPSTCK